MNDYAIVVLSGYPDIFAQFWYAMESNEPDTDLNVITSNPASIFAITQSDAGESVIRGPEPFSFPRNANIGIVAAGGSADVFLMNDDVRFLRENSVADLCRIAYEHPEVGILSPVFEGRVGNVLQERQAYGSGKFIQHLTYSETRLCFTGVYLRRSVINQVGLLDERFDGYGADDDDYCKRVQAVGLKLAVTPEVVMRHGFGKDQHSTSYKRAGRYPPTGIDPAMTRKWNEKWKAR